MNLLLLHAFPLDGRMWGPQRDALAIARHQVTAPDLYGLGSTLDEWAERALARVDGELAVVGASMGGYAALALARQVPERLRGLALVGSRATADPPEAAPQREETIRTAREEGAHAIWEQMRPRLMPADASAPTVEDARAIAFGRTPDQLVRALEAIRARPDQSDVVRGLQVPLLVAVGDADPFLPVDDARALAESAPQGRLHVFERTGHLPSLEHPEEFNRVLVDFLAEL